MRPRTNLVSLIVISYWLLQWSVFLVNESLNPVGFLCFYLAFWLLALAQYCWCTKNRTFACGWWAAVRSWSTLLRLSLCVRDTPVCEFTGDLIFFLFHALLRYQLLICEPGFHFPVFSGVSVYACYGHLKSCLKTGLWAFYALSACWSCSCYCVPAFFVICLSAMRLYVHLLLILFFAVFPSILLSKRWKRTLSFNWCLNAHVNFLFLGWNMFTCVATTSFHA